VKDYLSRKGVEFTDVNVSQDKEGARRLLGMGISSTPATVIGDKVIRGFDPEAVDSALAELGDQG